MDCRLVSGQGRITHHRLHRHVHPGNGRGILSALSVLGAQAQPALHGSWGAAFERCGVSVQERHALRRYLLQVFCYLPSQF
jgi:hypothetical protein